MNLKYIPYQLKNIILKKNNFYIEKISKKINHDYIYGKIYYLKNNVVRYYTKEDKKIIKSFIKYYDIDFNKIIIFNNKIVRLLTDSINFYEIHRYKKKCGICNKYNF